MPVQFVSMLAYREVKEHLTDRQFDAYVTLDRLGPATSAQVANWLGTYPHKISGRFTELKKLGRVKVVGRDICPIGRNMADFLQTCAPPGNFQEPTQGELAL